MKINSVGLNGMIDRFNSAKAKRIANKHVHIDNNLPSDVYDKLSSAQSTIANYAKSKGVKVTFNDANKFMADEKFDVPKHLSNFLSDKIQISVENIKDKRTRGLFLDADVNKVHTHQKTKYFIKDIPEDDTQVTRKVVNTYEDNFLRNVYRTVENLVKE